MKTKNYISLIILFFIIINLKCYGYQDKTGSISTQDVWSDTIHVVGDITVIQGGEIIIEPGAYIEFEGLYFINVIQNGKITAIGSVNDSITFTSFNHLTSWNGIMFKNMSESADSSVFAYCSFRYSKGALSIKKFDKVQVKSCNFSYNRTDLDVFDREYGGGIYCDSSYISITNSTFIKNYAGFGGGLCFRNSNAFISNTRIRANNSYWGGAGLYCEMACLYLEGCLIDSNYHSTADNGAGIYSRQSDVTLINCKLANNLGNAIYSCSRGGKLKLINTIISNNEGSDSGGLDCLGISLSVINSTIVNNKARNGFKAGGIYSYYCHPVNIYNSILWDNSGIYPDLYFENYYPTIRNSNIQDGNLLNIPDSQYVNNISLSPRFVNPSANIGLSNDALAADWSLVSCSPCINKGDSTLLDTILPFDYNNHPRIFNDTIDMGAYEFQGSPSPGNGTKIIYVKQNGTGNGSSWSDASGNLQNAINTPLDCYDDIEVWVSSGIYYPDTIGKTDVRESSFRLKNSVRMYGGFIGNESSLDMRNWQLNPTILSGDIGIPNDSLDNVYHVVFAKNINKSSVLDGFIISNGLSHNDGGGIYCSLSSPTLNNLMIKNNIAGGYGGGIYLDHSSPKITNSFVYNNQAYNYGGGICMYYSNTSLINTQIINNAVLYGFDGGGLDIMHSNPLIINSIIANNEAGRYAEGGGIMCSDANPIIINSIIANNRISGSGGGAGIYGYMYSNPMIYNSILWNNQNENGINHIATINNDSQVTIFSSLVQGGNRYGIPSAQFVNNFDAFPRFTSPLWTIGLDSRIINADWSLLSCSPCINHGDNSLFPDSIGYDFTNNNRTYNNIDIGPYEYQGNPTGLLPANIIYVKPNSNGSGSSWEDAIGNLQQAIDKSSGCHETSDIWIAAGTYLPDTLGLHTKRAASFTIRNNTHLYGGFAGNETSFSQRNTNINQSILSGNIGSPTDSTDNCNNVVTITYQDSLTILDGLIIKNGHSFGERGAGIYCKYSRLALNKTTLSNNYSEYSGGGLYAINSKINIENSLLTSNYAEFGGAAFLDNSEMDIENSKIVNNYGDDGTGGIDLNKVRGNILNCIISNNTGDGAGAISSNESNYAIVNSTLTNNECFNGPGGIKTTDTLFILNSILWNTGFSFNKNLINYSNANLLKIKNSDIKNGSNLNLPGENYINNIDIDPLFTNPNYYIGNYNKATLSNWRTKSCSPCVDKGFFDQFYNVSPVDIAGNPRIYNNEMIDIGAYEYQGEPRCLTIKFVIMDGNSPGINYKVSIDDWLNYKVIDSTGQCEFDNNSSGDKFEFDIIHNNNLILSDSIKNLLNDTIIYLHFNGINENHNKMLLIYPNPADDKIWVETPQTTTECSLIIYNMKGQEIIRKQLKDSKTQIDISNLKKGVYFVKSINGKEVGIMKMLKE